MFRFPLHLLLALIAVTCMAVVLLRARWRFSLRWLLMVVAMVAVVLGAVTWWQTAGRAGLERVDPASAEAAAMRPDAVVIERDGEFAARYVPRYRSIDQLVDLPEVDKARASARDAASGSFGITYYSTMQQVDYRSSSRAELEAVLDAVRRADVLHPEQDESVIFGIVVDGDGKPVGGATVDLMGPNVYINHFLTRDDGTFHMPITVPPGRGYHLRIRRDGKDRAASMLTRTFRYGGPGTELGLRVTID